MYPASIKQIGEVTVKACRCQGKSNLYLHIELSKLYGPVWSMLCHVCIDTMRQIQSSVSLLL